MNLLCSGWWILLIICWLKFENGDNKVSAESEAKVQNYTPDNYDKYNIQDSYQVSNNNTDAFEYNKIIEKPKVKLKWVNKQKKSRKKKTEKGRHSKSKKKRPKHKAHEKRKRKGLAKKFVKTINYRNKDSNMSDSQEFNFDENQVDVILHILK